MLNLNLYLFNESLREVVLASRSKNQSWDETFSTIALNKRPSESYFESMAKK
jgi:hypothetical protein